MTLSDLDWPFHASRAAVAELLVVCDTGINFTIVAVVEMHCVRWNICVQYINKQRMGCEVQLA